MSQIPKGRLDVLPHYSRLIATLNKYMPELGAELVAVVRTVYCRKFAENTKSVWHQLDDEFRYLQRKKNVVKELADTRRKVWSHEVSCIHLSGY